MVNPLINSIYRHFRLMAECPGGVGLTVRGRKSIPATVATVAQDLAAEVSALAGLDRLPDPPLPLPGLALLPDDKSLTKVQARLQWILEPDEVLHALVWGRGDLGFNWQGYLVVTDQRLLLLDEAPFMHEGQVQHVIPLRKANLRWPDNTNNITVTADGHAKVFTVMASYGHPAVTQLRARLKSLRQDASSAPALPSSRPKAAVASR